MSIPVLPQYNLVHSRPIIGKGHFGKKAPLPDVVSMIDASIVERKRALWDTMSSSPDSAVRAQALSLLKDRTLLAYSQLKFDNKSVVLRALQDAILSDNHDRIIFCGCNQKIGKSFLQNVDAATNFLMDHGHGWIGIIVSGSLPQSQFQMDRVKNLLKSSNVSYREEDTFDVKTGKKDNTTQLNYTFYKEDGTTPKYSNLLICCPHTSSALGYPVNDLWLDEFEWWENCDQGAFLRQVAIPRTFQTKGRIKISTNPNGRDKALYKLWNEVLPSGLPAWHRYHFNYWDAEDATQEEFDKFSTGMTDAQIESTMLAVFTRTEGSFFSKEEIDGMHSSELEQKGDSAGLGKECAFFLDVGSVHDQSVLTGAFLSENVTNPELSFINAFLIHKYPVGYPLARVVGVDAAIKYDDGWDDYAANNPPIKTVLAEYALGKAQPVFGYDATGNAGMNPLFASVGIDAFDVTMSGPAKWNMYQRFQYYVQQRLIRRAKERDDNTIRGCDFDYQCSKIVVKKNTKTVYRQLHHEREDDLDDCPDSIAGLIHLIENPDLPSLSFSIIDNNPNNSARTVMLDKKSLSYLDEEDQERKEQSSNSYIPSFMKDELESWMDSHEKNYR